MLRHEIWRVRKQIEVYFKLHLLQHRNLINFNDKHISHYTTKYGFYRRCEAAKVNQISTRIQPEGGHAKGEPGGYEKVSIICLRIQDLLANCLRTLTGGLQARSLKSSETMMMSLLSYASIYSKALDM